ncbi:hypothetical protein BCU66_000735 [Vibrio sp. 10N.286.49.B1]|uniref:hypothetical protein n=1 Tax=unclassified Vibrio TaxID=2614977 RepID=UPI001F53A071|nr:MULTISPECIES: hypothetical protein [unclassified Vibrio]
MNRLSSSTALILSKKQILSWYFRILLSAALISGLLFTNRLNANTDRLIDSPNSLNAKPNASSHQTAFIPIKCLLKGNTDHFWFYQTQLVYQSDQFALFQNFKGRVVTQIDLTNGQFSRTTYIGAPFTAKHQILFGRCQEPAHVLKLWAVSAIPFDQ